MDIEPPCYDPPRLPVSGLLATRHDGSPLDEVTAAILADIEAGEAAAQVRREARLDPVARANAAMTECAAEILLRAKNWALLHAQRAEARGLPAGAAAFAQAAGTYATLSDEVYDDGLSENLFQAARGAYWAAFQVTDHESDHDLPDDFRRLCREAKLRELGIGEGDLTNALASELNHMCREATFVELCKQPGFAQIHEVEASAIRGLCNALDCIIQHHGEINNGVVEPIETQARAAEELLSAPSSPCIQDVITCE